MGLNASGCAAQLAGLLPQLGVVDFPAEFARIYGEYADSGEVLGAVSGGGDASIIEGAMRSVSSSPASVDILAAAFSGYWATVAMSGDGAHGGAPVSIVNTAASLLPAFKGAISASIGNTEKTPYYEEFIMNIEGVVKTIVWTVTEAMPPLAVPTPFPEMIS